MNRTPPALHVTMEPSENLEVEVAILGGGPGGLTAAHELHRQGVRGRIALFERNSTVGGLARSGTVNPVSGAPAGKRPPTETTWHIWGAGYRTLLSMLGDVRHPEGGNVQSHWLRRIQNYVVFRGQGAPTVFESGARSFRAYARPGLAEMTWPQVLGAANRVASLLVSSTRRWDRVWEKRSWHSLLAWLPRAAYTYLVRATAPFLGVDGYRASATSVMEIVEGYMREPDEALFVAAAPTNEAVFHPWLAWLRERGLHAYLDASVLAVQLNSSSTKVDSIIVRMPRTEFVDISAGRVPEYAESSARYSARSDHVPEGFGPGSEAARTPGDTFVSVRVRAKWFVCALPVEATAALFAEALRPVLDPWRHRQLLGLPTLALRGLQRMLGVQIFFGERLFVGLGGGADDHGHRNTDTWATGQTAGVLGTAGPRDGKLEDLWGDTGLYAADTPWSLIIEPQGRVWNMRRNTEQFYGVRDIWSVGLCDDRSPGCLVGKPFPLCTREEVARDVVAQLHQYAGLGIRWVRSESGKPLSQVPIVGIHVWGSWRNRVKRDLAWSSSSASSSSLPLPERLQRFQEQGIVHDALDYPEQQDTRAEDVGTGTRARKSCAIGGVTPSEALETQMHGLTVAGPRYLGSIEPKFSPDKDTLRYRPELHMGATGLENMVLSAGYANTPSRTMTLMDGAAEAGMLAACEVARAQRGEAGHQTAVRPSVALRPRWRSRAFFWLLGPLRAVDWCLDVAGAPGVADLACGQGVLVLFLYVLAWVWLGCKVLPLVV